MKEFEGRYWCINCWSNKLVKRGGQKSVGGKSIQRYWCKDCKRVSCDRIDSITDKHTLAELYLWWQNGEHIKEPYISVLKAIYNAAHRNGASGDITEAEWPGLVDYALAELQLK